MISLGAGLLVETGQGCPVPIRGPASQGGIPHPEIINVYRILDHINLAVHLTCDWILTDLMDQSAAGMRAQVLPCTV